jgi:hypothetical protein
VRISISIVVTGIAILGITGSVPAQTAAPSPLARLEKEMIARITERAVAANGFRLGASEFDLRLPLKGEPEEIAGPTIHSATALAVGSARIEPLDSITSRDDRFSRARYALRLEDRNGNCMIVHQEVKVDSAFASDRRTTERCQPLYMAEVVRRARRIARLPLTAGRLDDRWSVALAATGVADVYMDSVVITTSSIALRASYPVPASATMVVDSVSAGLATGDKSWSVVRQSPAIRVDTTLRKGGEWRRRTRRFVIPVDSTFNITESWPVLQVHVRAPVSADNPDGLAWTYAHERKGFMRGITLHPAR